MGEKNIKEVKSYIKSSIELNVFLSITYTFILILFNKRGKYQVSQARLAL